MAALGPTIKSIPVDLSMNTHLVRLYINIAHENAAKRCREVATQESTTEINRIDLI